MKYLPIFGRRKRRERELDEELRAHLAMAVRERIEQGEDPAEAEANARREFGNVPLVKEVMRDQWGWRWLETLLQDVRYGLRQLRRNPGFTVVAVLTLALGIGANAAVFNLVNAVLLRPIPLPSGERVASIQVIPSLAGETAGPASPAQWLAWQAPNPKFELLAAVARSRALLTGIDEPKEIRILQVSPQLQELAGVRPDLGRGFSKSDFRIGSVQVCLISTGLWRRRFASAQGIIGRTLFIDSKAATIVGVLPEDIPFPDSESELWLPLRVSDEHLTRRFLDVYGRFRPGVSVGSAQGWLDEATARAEIELPNWIRTRRVNVTLIRQQIIADERTLLLVLIGIAVCVLSLCCANVSNLLLGKQLSRGREMALRASVGATPARLVRQLLTEALLLCAAGAMAGFAVARLLASLSFDFLSDSRFKALIETGGGTLDVRVVAFSIVLALLTTILFGLVPSLHFSRLDLNEAVKASPRGQNLSRGGPWLSRYLIAVELGITFVLLAGAGLLVQSFGALLHVDRGYAVDHLLTSRLPTPKGVTLPKRKEFFRELTERLEVVPDVRAVGVVTGLPLGGLNASMTVQRPGQALDPENLPWVGINSVNADYFKAMGIPVLRGRGFGPEDSENGMPVAVINETLARQFWPGRDAIGQPLMPGVRVIGIVPDIRQEALDSRQGPAVYLPFDQRDGLAAAPNFVVVRTKGDPRAFISSLRKVVHSIDNRQPVMDIRTMEEVLGRSVVQQRLLTSLMTLFAALAVALSVLGIYGVLSFVVSSRTREIGIRMCLGARRSEILLMLGRQLSPSLVGGLVVGLGISLAATAELSRWLFAIRPNDLGTLIGVAAITIVAAILGGAVPAARALRVNPLTAVRMEE